MVPFTIFGEDAPINRLTVQTLSPDTFIIFTNKPVETPDFLQIIISGTFKSISV